MHCGKRNLLLRRLPILACLVVAGILLSTPASAQTVCNAQLVIGFPNGDNLNRFVGQTVRMSLTITNGPSENGGAPDNQTFTNVDFFPSCTSVSGGVCTPDPGANPAAPPPIQYTGNLAQGNCPSLPVANAADPFDIKFSLTPPYVFADGTSCTFSFDVQVTETGSDGTPTNIAQLASTDGICDSTLTANAGGTSAITLTCPPCDDGNACNGVETCNTATALCQPGTPLNCNDNNACTADSCNPASGCVNTPEPPSFCDDGNGCTDDTCAPATGCVHTTKPPSFCDDQNACTTDACVPATGMCTHTPVSPSFCDDQNACTTDACVPATGECTHTPVSPSFCDDQNACTTDACVPATGQCTHTPVSPSFCDDQNGCTDDACVPATGQCTHTPKPPSFCDDSNVCTDDACVPATGLCTHTPKPPSFCDDNNACTSDTCDPTNGCVHTTPEPPLPGCSEAICRTPGFWGTHAGTEKSPGKGQPAVNITEAVLDCADGNCAGHTANDFVLICGEKIDSPDTNPADGTTDWNDASSSTEAMCIDVKGDSTLQLARQLTAAALNCLISGGGPDCAGTGIYKDIFSNCNATCTNASASQSDITACISQLDCLNNGGTFDSGLCTAGGQGNCHDRILVNESLGLNFEPPGSAGSSDACNQAKKTECAVVGPREAACATDSLP
ncbi:MAG TPA: hypothetical protein VGQ67_02615 [Candidatus Polarisedimenticolia bacterium]|nr:hypothetical protein [Candidatus Polarisedimenticolia bacterium]